MSSVSRHLDDEEMSEEIGSVNSGGGIGPGSPMESTSDWYLLVERIRSGDAEALTELYRIFGRGVRFYMYRQLGPQDLDDRVHDAFLVVVQAIQKGDLRDPARLMGFVRTIVRRQVATRIDEIVQNRREYVAIDQGPVLADQGSNPEDRVLGDQKIELMLQVLRGMSPRDREILTRFYLNEQSQEQICREMDLTDTQYRLLKNRAKDRFGELGRRALNMPTKRATTFGANPSTEPRPQGAGSNQNFERKLKS